MAQKPQESTTIDLPDGRRVLVAYLDRLPNNRTKLTVEGPNNRRWRLEANMRTCEFDVLTTFDSNGRLHDIPTPEWMNDVLGRLR